MFSPLLLAVTFLLNATESKILKYFVNTAPECQTGQGSCVSYDVPDGMLVTGDINAISMSNYRVSVVVSYFYLDVNIVGL